MSDLPRDPQGFDLVLLTTHVPVISGRVVRAIDQVAWTWAAEIAWTPGKLPQLDELVEPYAYTPSYIYLDGILVLAGWLYKVTPHKGVDGTTLTLEGASLTADLVDSTIPNADPTNLGSKWGDQWTGLSAWNIAKAIVEPLGIQCWTDLSQASFPGCVEPFDEVQCEPTDTYAEFLTRLAFQRGMLLTTNSAGSLVFTIAHAPGGVGKWIPDGDWKAYGLGSTAILDEGKPPALAWTCVFDGRKRFHSYRGIGQDDWGDAVVGEAIDAGCSPTQRRTTFVAGDTPAAKIAEVARWRRSAAVAEAMTLKVVVSGWKPPRDSKLWQPNTIVSVMAPSLFIANPPIGGFLIRSVEHVLEANGRTAILDLVPPETYTGEAIKEQWATVAPPHVPYVEGGLD